MNKAMTCATILLAASATTSAGAAAPSAEKPNIVLILLDDLGYSDLGCYGSEIHTPNIDSLARQGLRYRTFYNNARSAPTRAALMTGLYPHQVGVGALGRVPGYDNYQGYVNEKNAFIPEVLRSAGYFNVMTGKWHLGYPQGVTPITRGFDRSLNAPFGGYYFHNDPSLKKNGEPISKNNLYRNDTLMDFDSPQLPPRWYSTDMWVEAGLEYIDEAVGRREPFFWYLANNAPHFPLQAPPETIAKYRGKYMEGWETVRNRRHARQLEMGLFSADEPLTPRNPKVPRWEELSAEQRERYDLQMAIYAAVIEQVDKNVGRLVKYLKDKGIFDNTMIVILSDNGGNGEPGIEGRMAGEDPGGPGSNVFLGTAWADVANTPYYLYKHHAHEGGCNTPLIISWPAGMSASVRGGIDKQNFGHVSDIMPTLMDISGSAYPARRGNIAIPKPEGVSLVPSLAGEKIERKAPVIVEHEGNKMLRDGDWKVVQEYMEPDWMLYDMKNDPTEMTDLARSHPEKLAEMVAKYKSAAARTGVEPGIEFKTGNWYTPVHEYLK
jgi:arylsulfatase